MKFTIEHEIKGRIRIHLIQRKMTYGQADSLPYVLQGGAISARIGVDE